jgi:hypothetical protein
MGGSPGCLVGCSGEVRILPVHEIKDTRDLRKVYRICKKILLCKVYTARKQEIGGCLGCFLRPGGRDLALHCCGNLWSGGGRVFGARYPFEDLISRSRDQVLDSRSPGPNARPRVLGQRFVVEFRPQRRRWAQRGWESAGDCGCRLKSSEWVAIWYGIRRGQQRQGRGSTPQARSGPGLRVREVVSHRREPVRTMAMANSYRSRWRSKPAERQ